MYLLRPIRFLAKALTAECSSRQLALGFAMGLVIGLVPKGNLIAVLLMTILCASRVNLGAGMLTAFFCSWLGPIVDPVTHRIGLTLLTSRPLEPLWTALSDLPLASWTRFNNTVVLGSLVLGLVLFYPAYRLSKPLFVRYAPQIGDKLRRFRVVQLLWGTGITGRLVHE